MKKLWDLKNDLSYLELEGQGWGIIMEVTRPLLLRLFYFINRPPWANILSPSVVIGQSSDNIGVASQPEIQFSPISRDLMTRVWKFSYVTIVNRGTIKKWIKVLLDKIYVRDNYHRIQQLTLKLQIQNFDNQIITDKKSKQTNKISKTCWKWSKKS